MVKRKKVSYGRKGIAHSPHEHSAGEYDDFYGNLYEHAKEEYQTSLTHDDWDKSTKIAGQKWGVHDKTTEGLIKAERNVNTYHDWKEGGVEDNVTRVMDEYKEQTKITEEEEPLRDLKVNVEKEDIEKSLEPKRTEVIEAIDKKLEEIVVEPITVEIEGEQFEIGPKFQPGRPRAEVSIFVRAEAGDVIEEIAEAGAENDLGRLEDIDIPPQLPKQIKRFLQRELDETKVAVGEEIAVEEKAKEEEVSEEEIS